MIKVNLLNSVTERHSGTVANVERKVGSPASRLLLITIAVFVMSTALIAWDIVSTQMAKADAEARLEEQKRIAAELEEVMKEQKELEAKIASIDARIAAIKKLREEQAGPSAVFYDPPFGFPFTFINASIGMDMTFNDTDIAHMFMPWHAITTNTAEHWFEVTVVDIEVMVTNAHHFLSSCWNSSSRSIRHVD